MARREVLSEVDTEEARIKSLSAKESDSQECALTESVLSLFSEKEKKALQDMPAQALEPNTDTQL